MIASELLSILCCPETKQELNLAEEALIERLNQSISKKALKNRAGETVEQSLESGLVRKDGKFLYPVRSDIPVMLVDEAISLEGLL